MKSLVTSFFGVPSTAMNPLQREAHYSKPENDRRAGERRTDDRCECSHGEFWHINGGACIASTHRYGNHLVVGKPCTCVEYIVKPDRRVP